MRLMLPFLFLVLTASSAFSLPESTLFRVDVGKDDSVVVREIEFSYEQVTGFPKQGAYEFRMSSDRTLFSARYDVSFMAYAEGHDGEQIFEVDKKMVSVYLPFIEGAKKIEIFKGGKRIKEIPLEGYLCNKDDVCDVFEDFTSCPADCLVKENMPAAEQASVAEDPLPSVIFSAVISMMLVSTAVYFLVLRKR